MSLNTRAILEIKNLEFSYLNGEGKTQSPVLRVKSFKIIAGEKIFLYGPSGSGKTTLLELIAGVLQPTIGEVEVVGYKLHNMGESERDEFRGKNVGYIFQSFNLLPYLSVRENILLPTHLGLNGKSLSDVRETFNLLCKKLDIEGFIDQPVTRLSIGQAQRVAVARALVAKPQLILADEPTSSLDFERRNQFLEVLFSLCGEMGSTLIFVSHDLSFKNMFDRSLSLNEINEVSVK